MNALPPSVARILATHVIANERALECDWDMQGTESVKFVQNTVSRAFTISRIGTSADVQLLRDQLLTLWSDKLELFMDSDRSEDKCISTRAMRAIYVSLLCLGIENEQTALFNRLFQETVSAIRKLLDAPGNTPTSYLYNISKRLESLDEMTGIAEGIQPDVRATTGFVRLRTVTPAAMH